MGLAVVTSQPGALDGVAEGMLLAAPRDPAALAAQLVQVARDPGLRRRLGQSGRALALNQYGLAHQVARFEALYREVVA